MMLVVSTVDPVSSTPAQETSGSMPVEREKLTVGVCSQMHSYPDTERVVEIEQQLLSGNNCVRKGEWKMALKHYKRGIKLLLEVNLTNREEEYWGQKILLKLQLNTAYCCLKVKWAKKVRIACREALDIEKDNTKALFRFRKAKRMLGDYDSGKSSSLEHREENLKKCTLRRS